MNKIITIGRQFGSGGRELGKRLSDELGIRYYDKEILAEIANQTSMSEEYISNIIEQAPKRSYPITIGNTFAFSDNYYMMQMQSVYLAQDKIIRQLASDSDCIIIGRCADYILRDMNPCRIFVYSSMQSRVERCITRAAEGENISEKEMKKKINEIDKNRSKYYEFYTGRTWGDINNYDVCINTSDKVIKDLVPGIAKLLG